MRLHTRLTYTQVYDALHQAQAAGHVTPDVHFVSYGASGSRTHPYGYEIQLGTCDRYSLPAGYKDQHGKNLRVRRFKNSGHYGASSEWATGEDTYSATWHEWGWFIAAVFAADPSARWGSVKGWGYRDEADFNFKTKNQFKEEQDMLFPKNYSV
jgi:hypothetical protein